jgi:hypothetical protein
MKKTHSSILVFCLLQLFLSAIGNSISAQITINGFTFNIDDDTTVVKTNEPNKAKTATIKKENLDKKRKPELYTDCVREKGWLKGINKIPQDIASHRQDNFRFSEMNKEGYWTKIEIVDNDMQLKSGEGQRLLQPIDKLLKWAAVPDKIKSICCIDLEYDLTGRVVKSETATDKEGNVVYTASYKYIVDPLESKTIISVTYLQNNDAALFKVKDAHPTTIRYTYEGDYLSHYELIDSSGKSIAIGLINSSLVKRKSALDRYYRIDTIAYYMDDLPDEDSTGVHRIDYKYDDNGKIIKEIRFSTNGDTVYSFEETKTYRTKQNSDGVISLDSLDSHGNITWSAQLKDGKLLGTDFNVLRTTYNYYDPKHPNSFKSSTLYIFSDENRNLVKSKTFFQLDEQIDFKDSTYAVQLYNRNGLYEGGFITEGIPFKTAAEWNPKDFSFLFQLLNIFGYPCAKISQNGELLHAANEEKANAMIVSITGDRAKRLGLRNNDVIAKWDGWEYNISNDTIPDFDRLWLFTILTQYEEKKVEVLRQNGDSLQYVYLDLPKGNLDELQFTLIPGIVSEETVKFLRRYTLGDYYNKLWDRIIMGIPKNPYTHKPIIVYGGGSHPSISYEPMRPDPIHEWCYDKDLKIKSFPYNNGEKITVWGTFDLYNVESIKEAQLFYYFTWVSRVQQDRIFASYNNWLNSYNEKERLDIELPTLFSGAKSSGSSWFSYAPDEIIRRAIVDGNENGYKLWEKWNNSNNYLDRDHLYHKTWWEWSRKDAQDAKQAYIIPLDYSNEQQTLKFVEYISLLTLADKWHLYKQGHNEEYYVLIKYDSKVIGSKEKAERGKIEKGSQIFIYDRQRRIAALIVR